MNKITSTLAKNKSDLFRVSYTPEYKTLFPNFIVADRLHPLQESQRRRAQQRKKEGLWWCTTVGSDLSKSGCVRTWARRRLREAILEILRARGYDQNGKAILQKKADLKGSLRLHTQPPLVPAKFEHVKAEASKVIDILVQAANGRTNTSGAPITARKFPFQKGFSQGSQDRSMKMGQRSRLPVEKRFTPNPQGRSMEMGQRSKLSFQPLVKK